MLGAIAALALLPSLTLPHVGLPHVQNPFRAFHPGPAPEVTHERSALPGGWELRRTHEAFLGETTCRLQRREVRLSSGVVTFSFGHGVDTANALYRLDGGPVRPVGELGPEVAGLGSSYLSGNTTNPSDGRVRVPWTTLAGARTIEIRANRTRRGRAFALDSLDAAVAAARGSGCSDLV